METENIPFSGLDQYPDFEFYSTEEREDRIVKKFFEHDLEKWNVLKTEYWWLQAVPSYLNYHFPELFQRIIEIEENVNGIELHLSKPNRKPLSQEILKGRIDENQFVKYLDSAIFILCEYVYPINTKEEEYQTTEYEIDQSFFHDRSSLLDFYSKSKSDIFKNPFMASLVNSHKIIVNEIECPSVSEIFNFINIKNFQINVNTKMHTIHGNFYLNNILVEAGTQTQTELITFINSQNQELTWLYYEEFLGFPVIDFSCLLLNLECYLDEIYYEGYVLESGTLGYDCHVNFRINNQYSKVYEKGLEYLNSKRAYFAELQGVSIKEFTILSLCTEWLLLVNKINDIDRSEGQNIHPSLVLTGMLGLLGKRLLDAFQDIDEFEFPVKRLELG